MSNIAFIHIEYPCGGAEKVTAFVAHALQKQGHTCHLLALRIAAPKLTETDQSLHIHTLEGNEIFDDQARASIIRHLQDLAIDFVVISYIGIPFFREIHEKTQAQIVFTNHSMPFWEDHLLKASAQANAQKSPFKKLEWLLFRKWKYALPALVRKKTLRVYRQIYAHVDAYICLCEAYKQEVEKALHIAPSTSKVSAIYNPITVPEHTVVRDKKNQVVFMGRLSRDDKRIDRLLRIWQHVDHLTDWELCIYGEGPDEQPLREQAKQLQLKHIHFKGFIKDTQKIYDQAAIICLTSAYEGWPLILLEAQTNGVIPIAMNCSKGVETIISQPGQNGFLIPAEDEKRFAKELLKLMQASDSERSQWQEQAIQNAAQYAAPQIIQQWEELFLRLSK